MACQGIESGSPELRVLDLAKCAGRVMLGGLILALCQVCVHAQQLPPKPTTGSVVGSFFVPPGTFTRLAADAKAVVTNASASSAAAVPVALPFVAAAPMALRVLLYASPTTRAFMASGGYDAAENLRTWEAFLRKYRIPFQVVSGAEQLEKSEPGVLLLASTVALSEREKQAVIDFRAKGGGVLATWLAGVRGEQGEWRGFGFMEGALDVKVVGNTEDDKDDTFLIPYGDNPVTHALPAGLRVWLEHAKNWYPLRLLGRQTAANIMDWSRDVSSARVSSAIVFDERSQSTGRLSRSVVLGYPERLWRSADPKALEALAHNALMWLLRQPDAFVSNWPHPYGSAMVVAVGASDVGADIDVPFAKMVEDTGGRATYYVLSESAAKSSKTLQQLQARGHELAHYGDRFVGFRDQPLAVQSKRLGTMASEMKEAGLILPGSAGFRAPMDSYDATTEKLLQERATSHILSFMGTADARLPHFVQAQAGAVQPAKPMVVLPRTQSVPEELMETEPEAGLKTFLAELELTHQMAALSVVAVPGQSVLSPQQLSAIFNDVKVRRVWVATAAQVADWWRERERISATLEPAVVGIQLKVSVRGEGALSWAAAVWVNLPESGAVLRLLPAAGGAKVPKVVSVDNWRSAVVLNGLAAGDYQWNLYFDRPTVSNSR